jgi:hypothetical protein
MHAARRSQDQSSWSKKEEKSYLTFKEQNERKKDERNPAQCKTSDSETDIGSKFRGNPRRSN